MRNPYDTRFQKVNALHQSGQMVGKDRPVGRVTWSKQRQKAVLSTKAGIGHLRHLNKSGATFHEVGNIQSIDIDRSIGQDAATCTIVISNTDGGSSEPQGLDTAGRRGYRTPGRGVRSKHPMTSIFVDESGNRYPTWWNYPTNGYRDVFIPNTVIATFQGYGSDNFDVRGNEIHVHDPGSSGYVAPADDTQLFPTGVWLIDKAIFDATASTITLECRDFAKLLIEQVVYPPMIPLSRFPLIYQPSHHQSGHKEKVGKDLASFSSSSVDGEFGRNASIHGHRGTHAFDAHSDSYWLSGPNTSRNTIEWLQARVGGRVNEVVLRTWGGNYVAYISVFENGHWQGTASIPGSTSAQTANDVDQGGFFYVITTGDTLWDLAGTYYGDNFKWPIIARANNNIIKDPHWIYPGQRIKIPYVSGTSSPPPAGVSNGLGDPVPYIKKATIPKSGALTVALPRTYNARYVRVTFTHLYGSQFRAGVRTMRVRNHILSNFDPSTINKAGFISDWSSAIKELCAWGGFAWPDASPRHADPLFGKSSTGTPIRVWGDFEHLGAGPIVPTPADYFLAKTYMEAIRQVVDFIGGIFYVDETGGAQFRLPNIWTSGNFIDDPTAPSSLSARIGSHPIEFHEDANLITYSMTLSDEDVRSEILVVGGYPIINSAGSISSLPASGGYVLGYNPTSGTTSAIDFTDVLAGQFRLMAVPGDSTKLFYTERECQRMAELTALFILFTYRQGTLTSPAHPGLQIDDQVRIFERSSAESNAHYVSAISTHQDLNSGEYMQTVTTHWLGSNVDTDWFANKSILTPAVTQLPAILKRLGTVATAGTVPGT